MAANQLKRADVFKVLKWLESNWKAIEQEKEISRQEWCNRLKIAIDVIVGPDQLKTIAKDAGKKWPGLIRERQDRNTSDRVRALAKMIKSSLLVQEKLLHRLGEKQLWDGIEPIVMDDLTAIIGGRYGEYIAALESQGK